jgi:hypothetical protein
VLRQAGAAVVTVGTRGSFHGHVSARIFAFTDRTGRVAMKVQTYHLLVPCLRRHWMRNPRESNASLMSTIWVLAAESRSPSGGCPLRRTGAASPFRAKTATGWRTR